MPEPALDIASAVNGNLSVLSLSPSSRSLSNRLVAIISELEPALGPRANTEEFENLAAIHLGLKESDPSRLSELHDALWEFWGDKKSAHAEIGKFVAAHPDLEEQVKTMLQLASLRNPTAAQLAGNEFLIGDVNEVGYQVGSTGLVGLSKGSFLWQAPWVQIALPTAINESGHVSVYPHAERIREFTNGSHISVVTAEGWRRTYRESGASESTRTEIVPGEAWIDLPGTRGKLDPTGSRHGTGTINKITLKVPTEAVRARDAYSLDRTDNVAFQQRVETGIFPSLIYDQGQVVEGHIVFADGFKWTIVESSDLNGNYGCWCNSSSARRNC